MGGHAINDRTLGLGFVTLLLAVLAVSLDALADSGILDSQTVTILSAALSIMLFMAMSWTVRPLFRWIPWRAQWLATALWSTSVFGFMIASYPSTAGSNSILGFHIGAAVLSFLILVPDLGPLDERLNAQLGELHD